MDDDLFPSGPWTGFYNYSGPEDRHRMDLLLDFTGGRLTGDGTDNIGNFRVTGGYDVQRREAWWVKTYPGSHEVLYQGYRDGVGIWGTWAIPPFARGGFHIWPKKVGQEAGEALAVSLEMPIVVERSEPALSDPRNQPRGDRELTFVHNAVATGRAVCPESNGA
jgi:hypothetical protein